MRFQYEILPDKKFIAEQFQGKITLNNLIAALRQLNSDPQYNQHYNGIVDLTDAKMDMGFREIFSLVEYMQNMKNHSHGHWAFIAEDPLNFGVMRIFHSLTENDNINMKVTIFRNREDAGRWQERLLNMSGEAVELQRESA